MLNPRVKVFKGELQGKEVISLEGKKYFMFQGIPYAEPPIGELRFQPPVPKAPWIGVLDATKEGASCGQTDPLNQFYFGSEDCLFLNVSTPSLPSGGDDRLLPVMVYIHGGGFARGSGNEDYFSSDFIIGRDTVLVTINYRLNVLGFLCLDIPEAPGNNGLRDQTLAMKWVKENIRAFNGDPENITIFGISAGSASVEYHLLSPTSKNLFDKAVLQSGSVLDPWARSRNPRKNVDKLAKKLGITAQEPALMIKALKEVDAEKLVIAALSILDEEDLKNGEMFSFNPVVEKKIPGLEAFLEREPLDLLTSGEINLVPTITGFCENEGAMFKIVYENELPNIMQGNYIDYLPSNFNVDRVEYDTKFRQMYDQDDKINAVDEFLSDVCFLGGINKSLKLRVKNALDNYVYLFAYEGTLNAGKIASGMPGKGTFHSDDSSYLSSNILVKNLVPTPTDKLVRSRMVQMWTDFAKTSNPTPSQSTINPKWLPATSDQMRLMHIDEDLDMKPLPYPNREKLWGTLYDSFDVKSCQ